MLRLVEMRQCRGVYRDEPEQSKSEKQRYALCVAAPGVFRFRD
jgi:DNA gyrase inhibitor GyrI